MTTPKRRRVKRKPVRIERPPTRVFIIPDETDPDYQTAGSSIEAPSRASAEQLRQQIRDGFVDSRTDDYAMGILVEYMKRGRPFSLYLRNFVAEAHKVTKPPDDEDPETRHWAYFGGISRVEERLGSAVDASIRMIGVANPSDPMESEVRFPRLEVTAPDWERVVRWLVQGASFIVFDLDSLAPGVSAELELIAEEGRADDTLIILPGAGEQGPAGLPFELEILGRMGGSIRSDPTPSRDDRALAGFPRVASEDEIRFDALSTDAWFGDLMAAHARELHGKRDASAYRRRARFLETKGVWQHANDDPGGALKTYLKAKPLFFKADDPAGQAALLMNLGRAALDLALFDQALEVFRRSGATSRKFGDEEGFRGAVLWVGLTHYVSGDPATAAHYLQEALELERQEGRTQVSIDALDLLGRIYREEGDAESAENVAADLEALRLDVKGTSGAGELRRRRPIRRRRSRT